MVTAGALVIRPIASPAARPSPFGRPQVSEAAMRTLAAAMDRLLPGAKDAGAAEYLNFWLKTDPFRPLRGFFDKGASALDEAAGRKGKKLFTELDAKAQDEIIRMFIDNKAGMRGFRTYTFIESLMEMTMEGYLADPKYGGNKDKAGWKFIGLPDGLRSCWWNPDGVSALLGKRPRFAD